MYLTRRQLQVLDFLRQYTARERIAPTLDEIARHFGVSRVTIHEHLGALERKGALRRDRSRARGIELTPDGRKTAPAEISNIVLPILGQVQAGDPCEPFEVPESFDVSGWLKSPGSCHLLRVTGESMIQDQIRQGDLVLVDRKRRPVPGDIVVAAVSDGRVTLKRIFQDASGTVRLQPANPAMQPIIVDHADVRGVVIGLIRRY